MKIICNLFLFCLLCSCSPGEEQSSMNAEQSQIDKDRLTSLKNEDHVRKLFTDYISDINKSNWKELMPEYLSHNKEEFLKDHEKFRKAIADYHSEIKHLVIENNEAIAWLIVKGTHVGKYDGLYAGQETANIEPTGQALEWEEVWHFNVVGNQFGDKIDFLADDLTRMRQLGIVEDY